MTRNDTELLIQKYLNGETTAEEERLLALEVSREDAPEDWKIIAGMLGELTIDEALFDLGWLPLVLRPCSSSSSAHREMMFLPSLRRSRWQR